MEEMEPYFPSDTSDLDFSFTSTTTDRTIASSSARSSLARSSITLSFNERISISATPPTTTTTPCHQHPHRRSDPKWSAIKAAKNLSSDGQLHLRHLKLVRHVGTGDLGRVFLCQLKDCTSANFALKVIDRNYLTKKKLAHVQTETQILSLLDHPFLPTLYSHFEASHYTCLLIDFCPKGDLHSLLRKQPSYRLPLQAVKFYAAEVLIALEYLHANGIVYRDLKPENILLREDGHVMLSDFDLCFKAHVSPTLQVYRKICNAQGHRRPRSSLGFKEEEEDEVAAEFTAEPTAAFSSSCVGTHEYLAPELLGGNGYGNGVDWWAFGVLIYELLFGKTPFKGPTKEATVRNIASSQHVSFPLRGVEEDREMGEAKDLIGKLLVKDPRRRLGGLKGATDIKRHWFFGGINWALIRNYEPPAVNGNGVVVTTRKWRGQPQVIRVKRRQFGWWRGLSSFLKSRGSNCSISNSNYFRYKVKKHV